MSAPDIATLFDFEGGIEPGIKAALESAITDAGFHAYTSRETDIVTTPRVAILLQVGAVEGHVARHSTAKYFDTYQATLSFGVTTKRTGNSNNASHGPIRSKLRALMQTLAFGSDVLPYHAMSLIREAGTRPQILNEDGEDVSALTFTCIINIRAAAWPA